MKIHRVYLVPGFFGFTNLGDIVYFGHVRDFLSARLKQLGIPAEVIPVLCHPTSSMRVRATDLLKTLVSTAAADDGPIHLIGHSTGGLDARLFASPGVSLAEGADAEPFAQRVRTVVTVSTPHLGTPLATFFLGFAGQKLLQLLSLFTASVLRRGRVPLSVLFRAVGAFTRADDLLGWKQTILDQVFAQLLADFSAERQAALTEFFSEMAKEQALIAQLTPDGIDLFNASARDRASVRYGSVVTRASAPRLRSYLAAGLDPYAQVTHALFAFLHRQSCGLHGDRLPALTPQQEGVLLRAYGGLPVLDDSDGIVPTRSQPYGELIDAVTADHLDGIGHFEGAGEVPAHVDWLRSSSGFRHADFEALWGRVLNFVLADR